MPPARSCIQTGKRGSGESLDELHPSCPDSSRLVLAGEVACVSCELEEGHLKIRSNQKSQYVGVLQLFALVQSIQTCGMKEKV